MRAETGSNRGPSAYQPTALPLGQTGSRSGHTSQVSLYVAAPTRSNNYTFRHSDSAPVFETALKTRVTHEVIMFAYVRKQQL